jgi:hypothetical protein
MKQGGIALSAIGYIQVHAFTGKARIPLQGVAITITDLSGSAIAMRLTNRSGTLDAPVEISVPDISAGQTPDTGVLPFTDVNLYARLENFEAIEIENLQVFPGTLTIQDLSMIPLAELPDSWNKLEIFNTPPQNL